MLCELRKHQMFFDQVPIRSFTGQNLFTKNLWYGIIFLGKLTQPKHLIHFKTKIKDLENLILFVYLASINAFYIKRQTEITEARNTSLD